MKKRNVFYTALFTLVVILISGCDSNSDSDIIWDVAPLEFYIEVVNSEGADLLNPETSGNIVGDDIKAIYLDNTYSYGEGVSAIPPTRYYMPRFYGLMPYVTSEGEYGMSFGELDGAKNYKNEKITLEWSDKSQDIITFSHTCEWKKGALLLNTVVYLNGTEVSYNPIRIVK